MRRFVLLGAILLAVPLLAHAQATFKPKKVEPADSGTCAPTPKVNTANYPGVKAVVPGNNLLKPAGKPYEAQGQRLVLVGRVFDKNCMPLSSAIVEIWQTDGFGGWSAADERERATPDPVFAGSGRATTDGSGQFAFITAFPSPIKNRAPFINVRVVPQTGPSFTTSLYFANDARNADDAELKKLKADAAARLMIVMQSLSGGYAQDGYYGQVDLVVPGVTSTLRY